MRYKLNKRNWKIKVEIGENKWGDVTPLKLCNPIIISSEQLKFSFFSLKLLFFLMENWFYCFLFSILVRSVQISRSVMSNSLRPHESQHTWPPCPSPRVSTLLSRSGGEKGLRGGGAGKPQCSSRGRPGFRGTLWVASRVPSALSTSNS